MATHAHARVGTVHAPLASASEPCPECGGDLRSAPAFDGPAEELLALILKATHPEDTGRLEEFKQLREVWCASYDCDWIGTARRG